MRLNKFISSAGYCSRRAADSLIGEGRVQVEDASGRRRTAGLGDSVGEGETVYVDGERLRGGEGYVYFAVNKPRGIVCTGDSSVEGNIIDFAGIGRYVSYAGRLDAASTGLVLLTNDPALITLVTSPKAMHEKEYEVKISGEVTDEFLEKMQKGVSILLDDGRHKKPLRVRTRECRAWRTGKNSFGIILTQGYNRQIRRMCAALGESVNEIKRVRIMDVELGDLASGEVRRLTAEEVRSLKRI